MQPVSKSYSLSQQFEVRFVASRILSYMPVLSILLFFFWSIHSRWFFLFAAKYVLLLVLTGWLAFRKVGQERRNIEMWVERDAEFARSQAISKVSSDLLPLVGASITVGLAWSAIKHDARWLIACGSLTFLLGFGLALRWFVYERWMASQLRHLEVSKSISS